MIKVPLCRFQQSLGPFGMFFFKRPLKRHFTDIYLLTFFGDGNFGNTFGYEGDLFFENVAKFNVDFKNAEKN